MLAIENENKCSQKDLLQHEIEILAGIATSKEKYRKIVQAGIARWVMDFQKGQIRITTVDDLKKLIEIDLELQKEDL